MTQGQVLSGVLQVWIQSFPSARLTKAEESSLPYYLPIAGGRIIGFIPFPRVLGLCEMQYVSSRIWTRDAVSISYGDNHYTTYIYEHYERFVYRYEYVHFTYSYHGYVTTMRSFSPITTINSLFDDSWEITFFPVVR